VGGAARDQPEHRGIPHFPSTPPPWYFTLSPRCATPWCTWFHYQ